MNRKKLNKLVQQIEAIRNKGGIKSLELESLAKELGRVQSNRGKEPTWISIKFNDLRPLSIPRYGSRDLNRYTAGGIIGQLKLDIERWEEELSSENGD